jgi:hypothetical protein
LNGKSFPVLKRRRYGGTESVILRSSPDGSFAVPLEWTDWQVPLPGASRTDVLIVDKLLDALEIVQILKNKSKNHIDR